MPYGIPKEHGGDSPENVKKMESCVEQVMGGGKIRKGIAIAICKHSLFGAKPDEDEEEVEDED